MDTVALVESQIEVGQHLLDRLTEAGFIVSAACWLKRADEDRWSLYIATPGVAKMGTLEAYHQLIPVLQSLGNDWITSSDVTLLDEKHPMVKDVLDILRRFPHKTPIHPPRTVRGGIPVEELYIYPPSGITKVTVYGMIFRGEPGGTLYLSLEPHNPHSKLTIESVGQRDEYQAEIGIDSEVAAPGGAKLERDKTGEKVLAWDLHGKRMQSSANEVWSLAKLGLHGFRILREEPLGQSS